MERTHTVQISTLEIEGFKRFKEKQTFNTEGRIIAILGPNEAGKTSILKALLSAKSPTPFITSGPSQDTTRDLPIAQDKPILIAKFRIEKSDIDALKNIPGADHIRWFVLEKFFNGKIIPTIYPSIARDPKPRIAVLEGLKKLYQDLKQGDDLVSSAILLTAPDLPVNLETSLAAKDLPVEITERLKAIASALETYKDTSRISLRKAITDLVTKEGVMHPEEVAKKQLLARTPEFLLFEDQDRSLSPSYEISPFFEAKNPTQIPRALENLIQTAELDLRAAFDAARANDQGRMEDIQSRANDTLERKMKEAWSQSTIRVRLRFNGTQLTILVSSNQGGFEAISERSDGLRQFVALFALLSRSKAGPANRVCLLIDEAEFRLHYDAQADLVQMLTKQKFADKVIYTTHSFGCLPEDLGLGIRVVNAHEDNTSTIVSKFWANGIPGFSPVLAGMGATTMAFLPVRFCVLTEGAVDIVLLPSLLREATQAASLDFQIAPGLSETGEKQLAALRNEGRRVLFLIDGDEGGDGISAKLRKAGFDDDKQISLKSKDGSQRYLVEDFIAPDIYVAAVNEEFARSGIEKRIAVSDVGAVHRPTRLKEWCDRNEIKPPNKIDVAYRVLDQISSGPLLDEQKRADLENLHSEITKRFKQKAA